MTETRKPDEAEKRALKKAIDDEKRRRREAIANRERAKVPGKSKGSHRPSPGRTRKQIMDDLT